VGADGGSGWVSRANQVLDRLPRATLHLGAREVPAFRSLGVVGFHLAVLTALLTGVRAGVPALDAAALSAVAGASFFGWGLLRRAVTGRESLVLLEHVWVALGAVALLRWAAGAPVLPGLDVLAVGLCPFLACGRLGCLTAGCCHGQPAALGLVYPAAAGLPDRLAGVRLFPAPLVEAVALAGIGVAGFVLAGGPAGTATGWVLAAYATVRFGAEALRGDRRPAVRGVPVARLMCAVQLAAALALGELVTPGRDLRRSAVETGVLALAAVAGAVLAGRRRDPPAAPGHLDELWARIRALGRIAPDAGRPAIAETSAGVRLAASWGEYGLHVSLSHPDRTVAGLPYALGLTPLARAGTAVHVVVPSWRLPDRPAQWSPAGRSSGYDPVGAVRASGNETGKDYFGERSGV
jgi:hypothetical protein